MSEPVRRMLPWILLVLVLPVALLGIAASAPTACDELPRAFDRGVQTKQSNVAGGFIADRCETTGSNGNTTKVAVVNWSGLVAALGLCLGAWLLGAVVAGRLGRRLGAFGIAASTTAFVGATAAFFI